MNKRDKCTYCERTFTKTPNQRKTSDHILPQCRFNRVSLTVPSCHSCNQFKGSMDPLEFVGRLQTMANNMTRVIQQLHNDLKMGVMYEKN